jgi:hypothetical protein
MLARVHALEAGLPKSNRTAWSVGAKLAALPQVVENAAPDGAAVGAPIVYYTPRATTAAHSFQARAPPIVPA